MRVPSPQAVQQAGSILCVVHKAASTDFSLDIWWHYISTEGLKSSSMNLKGLHFRIISEAVSRAKHSPITSTLTIEHLTTAYVGGYTCTAVAGNIKPVESKVFKVLVSGTHGC